MSLYCGKVQREREKKQWSMIKIWRRQGESWHCPCI
jgi:hypothetical protein